jgi:beta-phosphoglucomutase
MKIRAVIFDVDGVLLDSVPYHFKAWKKIFSEQEIEFSFQDYLNKVNGLPRITGVTNMIGSKNQAKAESLAHRKQLYLKELINKKPPKPLSGVKQLLRALRKKGLKLAAASSSKNAPDLLESAGLARFLDTIVGGNDFVHPKPHPELFLTASQRLKTDPQFCLVLEDASIGIQAAKNAKMKTIGVLSSNDLNLKNEAHLTINSLKEIPTILKFLS